jgi:hypothetical protein
MDHVPVLVFELSIRAEQIAALGHAAVKKFPNALCEQISVLAQTKKKSHN